ncbi:hypothetical protein CVT24_005085 [Panaeolus cyanescens]|uniref:Uncharacterized protein n=1 Tax=Panaeolus cyanescens TaxID=181874 RepID=A0A409YB03_9AGAR|nr:hypothetical protein CVT24_005085 [Panaeolus cyanescens]
MWDTICSPEAMKRAENHFIQLQNDYWKTEFERSARIVKFTNTQASAIEILLGIEHYYYLNNHAFNPHYQNRLSPLIFAEILERIRNAQLERQTLMDEQMQLLTTPNTDSNLQTTLVTSLRDATKRLISYINQLAKFYSAPSGFDIEPRLSAYQCLLGITHSSQDFIRATQRALSDLPRIPSNKARRADLSATLENAKRDFQCTYFALCDFGSPPFGLDKFIPSVTPRLADRIALEALYRRHRLQRLVKRH